MPSDGSGNYSLPGGYLAVTGETIQASQHNPPLEDLAQGHTDRLMRSGAAPMTGAFKAVAGTEGAPGITFNGSLTHGFYKTTNGVGLAIAGTKVSEWLGTAAVLSTSVRFVDGGDIASANALTLGNGTVFNVTGTTAITSIATIGVGALVWLRFNAALTLTHHATDLILLSGANISTRAGDWAQFEEYATGDWRMTAYHRADGTALIASLPIGHLHGLTLSNNVSDATNDIDIAVGACRSDDNTDDIRLSGAITKRLDGSWAVGNNQGGLDTGSIANTTYHLWAVKRSDTGVVDVLFSASATSPTMPTNYDKKRRIGSILRESGAIVAFTQVGEYFQRNTSILSITAANPGTSAQTRVLHVPTGLRLLAEVRAGSVNLGTSVNAGFLVTPLTAVDQTPAVQSAPGAQSPNTGAIVGATNSGWQQLRVYTDTAASVRSRNIGSDANVTFYLVTVGWWDDRGRSA